jgi:CheY-like chemotaxis protein
MVQVTFWGTSALPSDFAPQLLPGLLGESDEFALVLRPNKSSDRIQGREQSIHVLLIEDDGAIADMYRLQLEYDGYQVTIATTGENGFATMATGRPDIVLLDLLLPDRSGFEIMVDIEREFPNHPPVVILSNYGEPTMIDKGFALGAIEYLVKSRVTPAVISQKIPGWIEQANRGHAEPDD